MATDPNPSMTAVPNSREPNEQPTQTSNCTTEPEVQSPLRPQPVSVSPSPRQSQRFVMNKVEKLWVLRQLIAERAPVQKMKTLDATCDRVAKSVKTRHVTDDTLRQEKNMYGICWRKEYMYRITAENVRHVVNIVGDIAKKVVIASEGDCEGDDGPLAAARGSENDAQHCLDQAVLYYKHQASKRTLTTDDDATRAMARTKESRAQKQKHKRERKEQFEENKRRRQEKQKAKEKRQIAADLQNLRAQTRIANAASASASLQRRQLEQFGLLVEIFAKSNQLQVTQPSTPLPTPLPAEPLAMDPDLVALSKQAVREETPRSSEAASGPSSSVQEEAFDAANDT